MQIDISKINGPDYDIKIQENVNKMSTVNNYAKERAIKLSAILSRLIVWSKVSERKLKKAKERLEILKVGFLNLPKLILS